MEPQQGGAQVIKAQVPLAEMFGYATTIRTLSQGRASYSMEPSHYEEVPPHVAQAVVDKAKKEQELVKA